MSSSLLITFATLLEAQGSIDLLKATQTGKNIWQFSKGKIAITGMGMFHALFGLIKALEHQKPLAIWNLGFAADLKGRKIGTIVEINSLCRPILSIQCDKMTKEIHSECYPEILLNQSRSGDKLVTVDAPIHRIKEKKRCALFADLIDLEGYAVASFAHFHQIECRVIKIASDFAQRGGRKLLFTNAPMLAQKLALWIEKKVKNWPSR